MGNLRGIAIVGLALSVVLLMAGRAGAQNIDEPDFSIEYSGSPSVPVVTYDIESAIESDDAEPLLRIYGDGRVHVHRPWFNRDSGDYEFTVSEDEMASLLEDLHTDGVMTFDDQSVAEQLKAARQRQFTAAATGQTLLMNNSDVEIVVVRVNLEKYRPNTTSAPVSGFSKEVRRPNLRQEADEYPEITELQGMVHAEETLDAYAHDTRLRKVAGGSTK